MSEKTVEKLKVGDKFISSGCPACHENSVKYEHCINEDGFIQSQLATCLQCGAMWMDIYRYSDSIMLKDKS